MSDKVVMVVDDEKEFADPVSSFLKKEGYEVITVYSAKEALDALEKNKQMFGVQKNRIRCIILDIKMPEMDGLQFLEKIRKDYQEKIGVIILSAYEDEEKWAKTERGLVAGYVTKPYEKEVLLSHLKEFFEDEETAIQKAGLKLFGKSSGASLKREFDPKKIREKVEKEMEEEEKKEKEAEKNAD